MQEKENFTRIPFKLFDQLVEKQMDVKDVLVFFAISKNKDGYQLSLRRLSKITGIPRPTIQKCIDRLVKNKYISKQTRLLTDTITIGREPTEIQNQYIFFKNRVDFDLDLFRAYPNFWLHLATNREVFKEIYPGTEGMLISAVDVVVLMFIKRKKFESEKQRLTDPYCVNFTSDAAVLGLTRGTFASSFKRLIDFRLISFSRVSKHVAIRNSAIKAFVKMKKAYALANCSKEELIMKDFTIIDQVNLTVKIREAQNFGDIQAIKDYLLDLFGAERITEVQLMEFVQLADRRATYLRDHYEETLGGETLSKEDFYPITTRNEMSMERALGHFD